MSISFSLIFLKIFFEVKMYMINMVVNLGPQLKIFVMSDGSLYLMFHCSMSVKFSLIFSTLRTELHFNLFILQR